MDPAASGNNTAPRLETTPIQGWRAEFRLWWAMTKHVDVVFDKSPASIQHLNLPNATPGSISMCRGCCQIVSTRTCSGKTNDTASGCAFHRRRPDVPIAVRSIIMSTRLREMLKPRMVVERYYLQLTSARAETVREGEDEDEESGDDRVQTNLMNVGWVRRIRLGNKETKRSKKVYVHDEDGGCIHSRNPDVIVQGLGPKYLYFKRCDGVFVNAFGEKVEMATATADSDDPVDEEQGEAAVACEKELAPTTSHDDSIIQSKQQDDDIRPAPAPAVKEGDEDEDDDDEFCQKPNPWANVIIDTVVKTKAEAASGSSENNDLQTDAIRQADSITQTDPDGITPSLSPPSSPSTTAPSPPPRSSSYRRKDSNNYANTRPTASGPTLTPSDPPSSTSPKRFPSPLLPPLPVDLDVPESELAELAWRRHNMALAHAEDNEDAVELEERRRLRRAQKRRWFLLWLR